MSPWIRATERRRSRLGRGGRAADSREENFAEARSGCRRYSGRRRGETGGERRADDDAGDDAATGVRAATTF